MGSSSSIGSLTGYASTVLAEAAALSAAGVVADVTHLFPIQSPGSPTRITIAGAPTIEQKYHKALEQGRFLETSIGDAMFAIQAKKVDLDEKIQQYLDLNRVAIDAKLTDTPRALKMVTDSIAFIQKVQKFINEQLALVAALQANTQMVLMAAARMEEMINANINALSNLLAEICNWGLPPLPSLPMLLGGRFAFPGFNLNSAIGYNPFNFNASFGSCVPNFGNPSSVNLNPTSVTSDGMTYQTGPVAAAAGGAYGDPTQYTTPSYIAQMEATTTPVYDPATFSASSTISLPAAASIISNYSLTAPLYAANICSACTQLNPVVIQPTDPDYSGTASASRQSTLRGLLNRYVNLSDIVATSFDANLTAAWLMYLQANRTGRSGSWIPNLEVAYATLVQPSLTYLTNNPVPWNKVLGGAGVKNAPTGIPLIATLQADATNHMLWQLSYIEASLLGYSRNVTWDAAADTTYLASATGNDLDYHATSIDLTATTTVTLGTDTAAYPVVMTYPTGIGAVLAEVIALATASIANTPSYQSTRPQFRFVYDTFAQATLVDRYSQFWRVFNANLQTLLAQDPYLIDFTVTYTDILNSAINPLADPTDYATLESDVASRNRAWTPGSDLLPIPKALSLESSGTAPTDAANGYTSGILDSAAYLSRPDVQAQPLSVQIAMLRTNQSYATLVALKGQLISTVADAISSTNAVTTQVGLPGWQIEFNTAESVPPGASGLTVAFPMIDFDQTGYVLNPTTVEIQQTNTYILNGVISWDPTGPTGTRTVVVIQNGIVVSSASSNDSGSDPYTIAFSAICNFTQGDVIEVQVLHSLSTPQSLLSGNFIGLIDTGGAAIDAAVPTSTTNLGNPPPTNQSSLNGTAPFVSGSVFQAFCAVSQGTDGRIVTVDPTTTTGTPYVDGISLAASTAPGESIPVAVSYGSIFNTPGTSWAVGGLLYVAPGGGLTQDYATMITKASLWIICIGKALTATSFLYEPHLPTKYL